MGSFQLRDDRRQWARGGCTCSLRQACTVDNDSRVVARLRTDARVRVNAPGVQLCIRWSNLPAPDKPQTQCGSRTGATREVRLFARAGRAPRPPRLRLSALSRYRRELRYKL